MPVTMRQSRRNAYNQANQAIKQQSDEGSKKFLQTSSDSSSNDGSIFNSSASSSAPVSPAPASSCSPTKDLPLASLSEYELQRQQVVAERLQFLTSLDIDTDKNSLRSLLTPTQTQNSARGIKLSNKRKPSPRSPVAVRRSLRLQPGSASKPLPNYNESFTSITSIYSPAPPEKSRLDAGLSLAEYIPEWQEKTEWDKTQQQLQGLSSPTKAGSGWTGSQASVMKSLKQLVLKDPGVAKVVPQRITTMAMHPSDDFDLVLCGDKSGTLGVWMPGIASSTDGAWPFEVHGRGITRLTVDSGSSNRVLTSSYDGSTRVTDINANKVLEVFSGDESNSYPTWHAQQNTNTLLVSTDDGDLLQVDLRQSGKEAVTHHLDTRKKIKLVTVHPTNSDYFVTANQPGTVCLWDSRNLRADKPVCSLTHKRTLTGLNFSSCTGSSLIATSHDNSIRLLALENFSAIKNERTINHDNHTGRWLTTLKADFLPGREDLFIVGSMDRARVVEVWNSEGLLCHRLSGELLLTFSTTVCCHPSRRVVAAGNASGRVHLFS